MEKVFIVMDCLQSNGSGFVNKVVRHLSTFFESRLSWGNNIPSYSENQDGSYPIDLPTDQMENYLKVFYITFKDEGTVYRVERRILY